MYYLSRTCTELDVNSTAQVLKVDPACVSRSVARLETRVTRDGKLKKPNYSMTIDLENIIYMVLYSVQITSGLITTDVSSIRKWGVRRKRRPSWHWESENPT